MSKPTRQRWLDAHMHPVLSVPGMVVPLSSAAINSPKKFVSFVKPSLVSTDIHPVGLLWEVLPKENVIVCTNRFLISKTKKDKEGNYKVQGENLLPSPCSPEELEIAKKELEKENLIHKHPQPTRKLKSFQLEIISLSDLIDHTLSVWKRECSLPFSPDEVLLTLEESEQTRITRLHHLLRRKTEQYHTGKSKKAGINRTNPVQQPLKSDPDAVGLPEHVLSFLEQKRSSPNYDELEGWIKQIPWTERSDEAVTLREAKELLSSTHYGLEDIKGTVIELLAIESLRKKRAGNTSKMPALLLDGPPGVGKTSIAKTIATSLGREFRVIGLGGIQDGPSLKGSHRSWGKAEPGKLVQAMAGCKTKNPVILLDEIDKLTTGGSNGDPTAVLLAVLDPSQNDAFSDDFLEIPVDFSEVLFIATSNNRKLITEPLQDRMELVEFRGYTREEKFHIIKKYLIKKAAKNVNLFEEELQLTDDAISEIVKWCENDEGVRKPEQYVSQLARKIAVKVDMEEEWNGYVTKDMVKELLNPHKVTKRIGFGT